MVNEKKLYEEYEETIGSMSNLVHIQSQMIWEERAAKEQAYEEYRNICIRCEEVEHRCDKLIELIDTMLKDMALCQGKDDKCYARFSEEFESIKKEMEG